MINQADLVSAPEAAATLGVKLPTIYAYASRGLLDRHVDGTGRSRYPADQVARLAERGRPRDQRRPPTAVEVEIGTTISEIGNGWIHYRDQDLLTWATTLPRPRFEQTAALLWTGDAALAPPPGPPSLRRQEARSAGRRAAGALPTTAAVSARLAAAAAAALALAAPEGPPGADDHARVERGLALVDALVAAVGVPSDASDAPEAATSVAERLWAAWSPLAATPARVAALDLALVLLAEHELATSTLAVRVAASTGAAPEAAVLAGIGTVAGPLHGQASVAVHRRLLGADAGAPDPDGPHGGGFGHVVHTRGDPRHAPLAEAVLALAGPGRRRTIEADRSAGADAGRLPPNVDTALGALGFIARAPLGATEAVFTIARTAGWLAHAFEEADEPPLRFRGRTRRRGT